MSLTKTSFCSKLLKKYTNEFLVRNARSASSTVQTSRETNTSRLPQTSDQQFMTRQSRTETRRNSSLFSSLNNGRKLYIMDKTISSYIPQILGRSVESDSCAVAVMYPGPGPLTAEMLRHNTKNLFLFEPHSAFRARLHQLRRGPSQNVFVSSEKFFGSSAPNRHGELRELLTSPNFSSVKIVSSLASTSNTREIVLNFINGLYENSWRKIEFYLIADNVSPILECKIPQSRRLRSYWAWYLWRFFVKSTKLVTFSHIENKKKSSELALYKCTYQLWPQDLQPQTFPSTEKERKMFAVFLRYCFNDPSCLVIATLEKLSPRIGLLILKRLEYFNLHTKFKELDPEELLIIYDIFRRVNYNNREIWKFFYQQWESQSV